MGGGSSAGNAAPLARGALLNYTKPQLVARLRREQARREEVESHLVRLVEQQATLDLERLRLETKLAQAHSILRQLGLPELT